jgi:SAM-dependent methyltransferase
MFIVMRRFCRGDVLDVGGWDFYLTAKKEGIRCSTWTTLEYDKKRKLEIEDEKHTFIIDDGCNMSLESDKYDTVINIQVLEHVFEPIKMVHEIARVLKKTGYAIFLIPQTSTLHGLPHYYNFTIFWIKSVMESAGLEIIELKSLGGIWSSMASHLFYFIYHSLVRKLKSPIGHSRSFLFYLLYPFMVLYAVINIPICMIFSIGDLKEEPNNHLVVVRKR